MKQTPTTEEIESQVDKSSSPKTSSPADLPLWLVTSFVLFVVSWVSLVYYFFVKRLKPRHEKISPSHPLEPRQAGELPRQGLDIIKSKPVFNSPVANVEQPVRKGNSVGEQLEPSSVFSFSALTSEEQIKKIVQSISGPVLALAIVYFAQSVIDSIVGVGALRNSMLMLSMSIASRWGLGLGGYLIAVLIWVFTAPAMRPIDLTINQTGSQIGAENRYSTLRFVLLLTGIGAYLMSVLSFTTSGENSFVRILWGVGLVCFILSQILSYKTSHPEAEASPRFQWQNWFVLALILGVGFWLRYYQIATIPDDFHGDMASHGWVARDFLLGIQHDIFGFGWTATPTIGFLPAFLTMAVFGNNIYGLQMAAVIGGVLSLFAIYLLSWRLFNNHRLAALATALVAINIAHIHFSRIFNMDPWPLSNFAIFFLIDGLKARRPASFGLAGVLIGFSMLMYTSGRALPFIILVFLVYAFFFQRHWITQNKRGFVLLIAGFLIAMGPALVFYLIHWDLFISRSREVFLFSQGVMNHLLNKYNTDSTWTVLVTQIKLSLLMFNQAGDTSSQFGYPHPMFNSLVSPLILLGLGFALRRWKEAGMIFVLIWLVTITILGSVLTIDAPFWPRLIGIVPAAALLIAIALEQILELGRKVFGAQAVVYLTAFIVIFLATVGYLNWNEYYLSVKDSGSPSTVIGRYIGRLPDDVTACGIISGNQLTVRETAFLAWPRKLVDIQLDAPDSELDKCTGSSLVWVLSPENLGRLDAIRARWPNGVVQEIYLNRFSFALTFYVVGVTPPDLPQPEAPPEKPSWLLNEISIITPFVLSALLVWFFFQGFPLKLPQERQTKKKVDFSSPPAIPSAPPQPVITTSSREPVPGVFASFDKWYNEIVAFKPSAVNLKLLASILLPLAAVGLAYFAQTFLDQEVGVLGLYFPLEQFYLSSLGQRMGFASLIFLIAALLWVFSTTDGGNDTPVKQGTTPQGGNISQPVVGSPIQIIGIFFTVSAIFSYAVLGENSLVRGLWLVGLILFLASLFVKNQFGAPVLRDESPAFRWVHTLTLFFLLGVAFYLRVYHLYDIPLDLSTDMASVGIGARDYLLGVEQRIFGTGWYFMPRVTFIPYAASMAVAGNNLFGLYFATVVMGTLNVLGTYLFIWRLFDKHRLALLTAVLVAINPAHINLSRITSYMDPWFFAFFGLFFFVDGLKGRRWGSLALAGLFTGFTLISYPSGRAIIPLIAIGLACFWFFRRNWVTDNYGGLGWMALGMFVALGPNLVYFITDWSVYMQRSGQVVIFNPGNIAHLKYTYETDSMWVIIWEQVKRSVLQFNYYFDRSAQFSYPHPMFNSLISPLIFLGFGMSLYRWKKPEFLFTLSSLLFILTTGSVLTIDPPTWVRVVGVIPFAALLIALVMDEFINILERVSLKAFIPLLLVGMTLFLGELAVVDWNAYLRDVGNEDITRPEVHVARYLDSLPDQVTACGITDEYLISQEEILFMGWPRSIIVVPADTAVLTPDLCPSENVVWILAPKYKDRLSELQIQWPGGTFEDHLTKNGWHVFTSYLVPSRANP